MPDDETPPAQDLEQVNATLDKGLKSCHQVVSSYRLLFRDQQVSSAAHEPLVANDRVERAAAATNPATPSCRTVN